MPYASRSWWFSLLASLVFGLATGYATARYIAATRAAPAPSDPAAPVAPDVALKTQAAPTTDQSDTASAARVTSVKTPSAPLPPADAPIAEVFESLAERARAGDAPAARRLAEDLRRCIERERDLRRAERILDRSGSQDTDREASRLQFVEKSLGRLRDADRRCAQLSAETIGSAGEWLRQAALNGDAEARLCYALAPNEWGPPLMTPAWQQWSARWQQEAPQQLRLALESGQAEAAAALSRMYTPWQPVDGRPWGGVLGDDPYQAYAYAVVAQGSLPPELAAYWSGIAATLATRMSAERVTAAQALARQLQARVRAAAPPPLNPANPDNASGQSFCRQVRGRGGVF